MAESIDLTSREFLLTCLRKALGETEVLLDICDVCTLSDINASVLASGELTVAAAADRLYLTESEATAVLDVCKRLCDAGGVEPELAVADISLRLIVGDDDRIALQIGQMKEAPQAVIAAAEDPKQLGQPSPSSPSNMGLILPSVLEEETPAAQITAPVPTALLPLSPSQTVTLTSPSRLGLSASMTSHRLVDQRVSTDGGETHSSGLSDGGTSPSLHIPSYLRPTASSKRQTKKEREAAAARELKPEPAKLPQAKRGKNVFARLGHTLLAPTATFLARVTGKGSNESTANPLKSHNQSVGSRMLEKVLDSPQGQRVTRPAAFKLAVDTRPKTLLVSSEDLALAKAQEKIFKPHMVPKHVHEARPLEFRAASSPKKPEEVFVPFQLASLDRHARQIEELRKQADAEKTAAETARQFRAIEWSKGQAGVESPTTPRKPEAQAVTVAKAFNFKSEDRIAHYHSVIEPIRKAKEAEQNKEKLEDERKIRELEELSVADFRKTLDFKAIRLPDFSAPFRPDASLSASPTAAREFSLHTTARLGDARPVSAREDLQGHRLGFGDAAFANSLRGSSGSTMVNSASLRRSTNSLSRSVNGPLSSFANSQSAANSPRGSTPRSPAPAGNLRNSLNMSLRASLRASLTQGLKEAKLAAAEHAAGPWAAVAPAAASGCVVQEAASSRRSTHESLPSSPMAAAF